MKSVFGGIIFVFTAVLALNACVTTTGGGLRVKADSIPTPEELTEFCRDEIGPPRVEKISENVWAAFGYDQVCTVLIKTSKGVVLVNASGDKEKAGLVKKALFDAAGAGPVLALIYTRCHINNMGGASVMAEENTQVWSTDSFYNAFLDRFMLLREAEHILDRRVSGSRVPKKILPCKRLGPGADPSKASEDGIAAPTHTFSGTKKLFFGDSTIELHQCPGPDQDRLFVWLPKDKTLIAGDEFTWSFPVFHSFNGSTARSVDDWIAGLDLMRSFKPDHLIPASVHPVTDPEKTASALTDYRDSLQWIRDAVLRGLNQGDGPDELAAKIGLPPHLAGQEFNKEIYGRTDWAVRDLYAWYRGAFDGNPEMLFPLPSPEAAKREIDLMGGPDKVLKIAEESLMKGDVKWAIHLLVKMHRRGPGSPLQDEATRKLALALEVLGRITGNTLGRAYLLESTIELREGSDEIPPLKLSPAMVSSLPLSELFKFLTIRLKVDETMELTQRAVFVFPDEKKRFSAVIRRGILEVTEGASSPGGPDPVAVVDFKSDDFRRVIAGEASLYTLFIQGKITVQGSWVGLAGFLGYFDI